MGPQCHRLAGTPARCATVSLVIPPDRSVRPHSVPRHDRCTTPDGLGIEILDFGGSGQDLLVVHATGFCAAVLGPMARHLGDRYHCWGLDLRAHGRSDRPVDGDFRWEGFATDVLTVIDHLGLDRPAGFGHSCGGASVLLAEEAHPGTFDSLYCFEPVVFPGPPADLPTEENPLSVGARRRRETFPSADDALANFAAKPPFASLDAEALRAYVDGGFELVPADAGGDGRAVRLRCRRDDEAEVYAHGLSHGAYEGLARVACPVTLVCGEQTDSFGVPTLEQVAARLPGGRVEVVPGVGHFGPLEAPARVADSVLRALDHGSGTPPS